MAVRIRMKRMGRRHRPYFRICAMDSQAPRDGRALEELGTYDPMIPDTDARAQLKGERIQYWLGVGAQPSDNVKVLIKKYGLEGTHLEQQKAALDRLAQSRRRSEPAEHVSGTAVETAEEPADGPAAEAPAEPVAEAPAEQPVAEAPAPAEEETKTE